MICWGSNDKGKVNEHEFCGTTEWGWAGQSLWSVAKVNECSSVQSNVSPIIQSPTLPFIGSRISHLSLVIREGGRSNDRFSFVRSMLCLPIISSPLSPSLSLLCYYWDFTCLSFTCGEFSIQQQFCIRAFPTLPSFPLFRFTSSQSNCPCFSFPSLFTLAPGLSFGFSSFFLSLYPFSPLHSLFSLTPSLSPCTRDLASACVCAVHSSFVVFRL